MKKYRQFSAIIAFCLIAAPLCAQAKTVIDRLEASVNSSIILLSDVAKFRRVAGLRAQLDPLFGGSELSKNVDRATDRKIVEFLIDEKIIGDQFKVDDAKVEQEINSIVASNRITRDALESAIKQQGYAFTDYFELIRVSVAKRDLIDRDIRTKVYVSDDDVKNHFYNQMARGSDMSYRLKLIAINRKDYQSDAAAQEVGTRAIKALRSGENFDEVAKRFSGGPNAERGGDLGFLNVDEMSPEFRKIIKKLKVGETSDLAGGGAQDYFILKLADLKSDQEDRLEKMKEQIRNELASREYQVQIELWLERQRDNAFIHHAGENSYARAEK